MTATDGASGNIYRAFSLAQDAGREIGALHETVCRIVPEELSRFGAYVSAAPKAETTEDPDGWVCTSWQTRFSVRHRKDGPGRHKDVGIFYVHYDIGRSGYPSEALGRAVIHIGWSTNAYPWDVDEFGWPPDNVILRDDRVFQYVDDDVGDRSSRPDWLNEAWLYLVPLGAMRQLSDVRRLITNPAFSLLWHKKPIPEVLRAAPEVLMFDHTEEGVFNLRAG